MLHKIGSSLLGSIRFLSPKRRSLASLDSHGIRKGRGREVTDGAWDSFTCISPDGPVFKVPYDTPAKRF